MSELIGENSNKKKSLGRGLGSLLGPAQGAALSSAIAENKAPVTSVGEKAKVSSSSPVAPVANVPTENRIWNVGVDKLKPSAFQPRTHFDKAALEELSISIKTSGILQPIVVRKSKPEGSFEIVAGERRWRASQLAGLHEVPVIVKDFSDKQALELALIENIQREDLNPIEEAEAYQRLADEFNLTQAQVAERVGKERATVANSLRLLSLPNEIQEKVKDKKISVGHAKLLMGLPDPKMVRNLALQVENLGLSVRALEVLIKKGAAPEVKPADVKTRHIEGLVKSLQEKIQKTLGTKATIEYDKGKGKLSVYFYSDEELNQIADILTAKLVK